MFDPVRQLPASCVASCAASCAAVASKYFCHSRNRLLAARLVGLPVEDLVSLVERLDLLLAHLLALRVAEPVGDAVGLELRVVREGRIKLALRCREILLGRGEVPLLRRALPLHGEAVGVGHLLVLRALLHERVYSFTACASSTSVSD